MAPKIRKAAPRPRIGTSGWSYPFWRAGFYAGVPQRRWLAHCAAHFTAVEVNASFYHEVKAATLERFDLVLSGAVGATLPDARGTAIIGASDQPNGWMERWIGFLRERRLGYIYNAWADGKTRFRNESQSGLTMKAMEQAAETDPGIAERVKLFLYRVPEELYDFARDPDALHNLARENAYQQDLKSLRQKLLAWMQQTQDPLEPTFRSFLQSKPS